MSRSDDFGRPMDNYGKNEAMGEAVKERTLRKGEGRVKVMVDVEKGTCLVQNSGLSAIAQECYRLAVARGAYPDSWDLWTGYTQLDNELEAWWDAAQCGDSAGEIEEMGDLLHTVLSVAHHRGIDVEAALRDAMQRNAERARRGE